MCYIMLHEYMYVLCQLLQSVAALFFGKVVQYNVNVRVTADTPASVYCLVCFCLIWGSVFLS